MEADTAQVSLLVEEESVGTQVAAHTSRFRESVPVCLKSDHVPGATLLLESATVFVPSHKSHKSFGWLRHLDPWTAIRGSEGEPEMTSVLRPGSKVLVLETFEELQFHRAWVAQSPPNGSSRKYTLDSEVEEEVLARNHGRLLTLHEPLRYVFGRVQVTQPALHSSSLVVADPCGFAIHCGDRSYEVAAAPDYTGGYLETPGVTGVIFLQALCETMTWTLSRSPCPAHKDHDPSRRHEDILRTLRSVFGTHKPKAPPGRAGAKNFRRRQRRRQQKLVGACACKA